MSISLFTGNLGSGKSYLAVNHLVTNYYSYDKDLDDFACNDPDLKIITNIDGFLPSHINLRDAISDSGKTVDDFFTVDYQEKIAKKYPKIIYIIDEAQNYFPRRNKIQRPTWYYFEYCRHFGHDIILITQHQRLIAENLIRLVEKEFRALPRTVSIDGRFVYNIISNGVKVDRKKLVPSKKIFRLYKSMTGSETEKIHRPLRRLVLIMILLFVTAGCLIRWAFWRSGNFDPMGINGKIQSKHTSDAVSQRTEKSPEDKIKTKTLQLATFQVDNRVYGFDPRNKALHQIEFFLGDGLQIIRGLRSVQYFATFNLADLPVIQDTPKQFDPLNDVGL